MSGARARYRSPSREAGMVEADARRAWATVLARMGAVAREVAAGRAVDKVEKHAVAGLVIRLKAPFPQRWPSAQAAAEAFLVLSRAMAANDFPASIAGFVAEGAKALGEIMEIETRAAFARSCRAAGE